MTGYLIAEEGPLSGTMVVFEEGEIWTLGRDPDEVSIALEDPMVSRKHAICRLTGEGYILENLSSINPVTQNGKVVAEPVLLKENDIIQIGSTFFRFTQAAPQKEKPAPELESPEELEPLEVSYNQDKQASSWFIKVITGPNSGAEFNLHEGTSYTLGKEASCDVVFNDMSVSRQHAKLTLDLSGALFIEDLGSKNGVLINGLKITQKTQVSTQDVIALGTTSFMCIDKEIANETLVSFQPEEEKKQIPIELEQPSVTKDWKGLKIAKKHLAVFSVLALVLLTGVGSMISLFNTTSVTVEKPNQMHFIEKTLKSFPSVQYSYNATSGKLFLIGHVLTNVDKQELIYALTSPSKELSIEDNVVVDELVWQNMNALLSTNPSWEGVSIYAPTPGKFIARGYLQTINSFENLSDFLNLNFPYLDKLENQVVVESNLQMAIQGLLIQQNFSLVQFQLSQGELVLSGKVPETESHAFEALQKRLRHLPGIRSVKSFVVLASFETSRTDLSTQYAVTGFSKSDHDNYYVVVNGKIVGNGDNLDGMLITQIDAKSVYLEKDGLKFLINYNLQ